MLKLYKPVNKEGCSYSALVMFEVFHMELGIRRKRQKNKNVHYTCMSQEKCKEAYVFKAKILVPCINSKA